MGKLTVVIEYGEGQEEPRFHAGMTVLGGEVVAVQFDDALIRGEKLTEALEKIRDLDYRGNTHQSHYIAKAALPPNVEVRGEGGAAD
jgi:hypothetical protein